ncbi:DUF1616 domain-containing protein [Halosimplex amylolyticum]|uniref:DUF1616 domain-containing protein n=1 Tax=Halosimplex amylolyticum TaxID=3396616 RepID=UPI003F56473E
MNDSRQGKSGRRWPLEAVIDLVAVAALVVVAAVLVVAVGTGALLTTIFGFALVTFAPGYAFVAAVFPEAGGRAGAGGSGGAVNWRLGGAGGFERGLSAGLRTRGIDGIERFALSVGLSVALVPLIGIGMDAMGLAIRPVPVVQVVSAITLGLLAVATVRRMRLPDGDRFRVPYPDWSTVGRGGLFETRFDGALTVLFAASLLFAAGSVGFAVATPPPGDTDFSLLAENESGALVAEDYPTEFERGQSTSLAVSIANREHEATSYSVVVLLQRVRVTDGATEIREVDELERRTHHVGRNETEIAAYDVAPTLTGDQLRLSFLLYRGGAPDDPTTENAYRRLQLRINASEASE